MLLGVLRRRYGAEFEKTGMNKPGYRMS